jgi:hypothetical protein
VSVGVPGHLLRGRDLQFVNAETRPLRMTDAALDLVELARVLEGFHD